MNNNSPKVIFRMVAHNSEETIARAIESVLAQTYENLELHIGIRGGTDSTAEISYDYAKRDPRIRVIINKQNFEYDEGNNITDYYNEYDIAKDFVCFMDADDEYKPDFLEKMVPFAVSNNLDIAACGNDVVFIETGEVVRAKGMDKPLVVDGEGFCSLFPNYHNSMGTRWAKLFGLRVTDRLDLGRIFWVYFCDDAVEAIEYFRNADRVGIYPDTFYKWYYSDESLSHKWDKRRVESNKIVFDLAACYLIDKTGRVASYNYNHLCDAYFTALKNTLDILFYFSAEVPLSEKLAVLHDIFTCRHTREAAASSAVAYDSDDKKKLFAYVAGWLSESEGELISRCDAGEVSGVLSAVNMLSEGRPRTLQAALWAVQSEDTSSVLEISGFDDRFGKLLAQSDAWEARDGEKGVTIDRIDLTDGGAAHGGVLDSGGVYGNVFGSDALSNISTMEKYDVIVVFHLFENMNAPDAKALLEALLTRANKQVLVITPEYPYDLQSEDENKKSDVRAYHPAFFIGMDFSYKMMNTQEGKMQAYSLFPKSDCEPLQCDELHTEAQDSPGALKIGYILSSHNVYGTMKGVFRQMKEMAEAGHRVTAYLRSNTAKRAVPGWSGLADGDISAEVVVPLRESFLDYTEDEDMIILTWRQQVQEFEKSKVPVALWEHGSELFGGDYGRLVGSSAQERALMQDAYGAPVHLLAVSPAVQAVLKGVYNREAQFFPCGINTDLFRPREDGKKTNEVPVVLLAGNPREEYSGLMAAFSILDAAYRGGAAFKAVLVTQTEFSLEPAPSFAMENIIAPPQEKLAEIYRNADIFLWTSLFDPFPMPPLEAMASGVAVITTDCGGIGAYAEPGVNCLMCEHGDMHAMLYALKHLLGDRGAREQLAIAGRETAQRYSHANLLPELERCLRRIVVSGKR